MYIIMGAVLILLIIILVIFLVARRRKKRDERESAVLRESLPQGVYAQHPYQSPQGQFQPVAKSYGPQPQDLQAFPPAGAPQHHPALAPMAPPQQQTALPPTAQQQQTALPQVAGQMSLQPQTISDPSDGTTYSLPPFSTDEGEQDLNLMALPPGPDINDQGPETAPEDPFAVIMNMQFPSITPETQTQPAQIPPGSPPILPDTAPTENPTAAPNGEPSPHMDTNLEPPAKPGAPVAPIGLNATGTSAAPPTPPPVRESMSGPVKITMQCHACGNNYEAEVVQYPALVTCPVCMTQGVISGG